MLLPLDLLVWGSLVLLVRWHVATVRIFFFLVRTRTLRRLCTKTYMVELVVFLALPSQYVLLQTKCVLQPRVQYACLYLLVYDLLYYPPCLGPSQPTTVLDSSRTSPWRETERNKRQYRACLVAVLPLGCSFSGYCRRWSFLSHRQLFNAFRTEEQLVPTCSHHPIP